MRTVLQLTVFYETKSICQGDNGQRWLSLEKIMDLPFVPSKEIEIGNCEDSTIDTNVHKIEKIVWNSVKNEFHIDLECYRAEEEYLPNLFQAFAEEGWNIQCSPFSSVESLKGCVDFNDYAIVKIGDALASVSEQAIEYMKIRNQSYELVEVIPLPEELNA